MANSIEQVRPTSTFETFIPQTPVQQSAVDNLRALAQGIVERQNEILDARYPFRAARLIFIAGRPGRGKTHLLEAVANHVLDRVPSLKNRMYLENSSFTINNMTLPNAYDNCLIVLIDDMFSRANDISELSSGTDIKAFMNFIDDSYNRRRLVVATCNFSLTDELLAKVEEVDKLGRTISRLKEILPSSSQFMLDGPDYRDIIAKSERSKIRYLGS